MAFAATAKVANATRDVLRDAALIGQRDKRARSEANKEAAAAAAVALAAAVSSPAASATPATAVGPAAARERTSSGLPEMRRRSSAMVGHPASVGHPCSSTVSRLPTCGCNAGGPAFCPVCGRSGGIEPGWRMSEKRRMRIVCVCVCVRGGVVG